MVESDLSTLIPVIFRRDPVSFPSMSYNFKILYEFSVQFIRKWNVMEF